MVAMGMGDKDVRHRLVAHGIEQRADVAGIVGAGIDNGDATVADDVAERAFEGERARIVGHDSPHAGHHLIHPIGREIEILVERNVVAHADSKCPLPAGLVNGFPNLIQVGC